eukprot:6509179-Pyramimonas_sp.AAC.1
MAWPLSGRSSLPGPEPALVYAHRDGERVARRSGCDDPGRCSGRRIGAVSDVVELAAHRPHAHCQRPGRGRDISPCP